MQNLIKNAITISCLSDKLKTNVDLTMQGILKVFYNLSMSVWLLLLRLIYKAYQSSGQTDRQSLREILLLWYKV